MVGYKSKYWKWDKPFWVIVYNPDSYRKEYRIKIIKTKVHGITRCDSRIDHFEVTPEHSYSSVGIWHKSLIFRSLPSAIRELKRLIKEQYEGDIDYVNKIVKECV